MTPPGAAPEQHTPGPWKEVIGAAGSGPWDRISIEAGDFVICSIFRGSDSAYRPRDLANARLIARAPALHAENEALRKGLEQAQEALLRMPPHCNIDEPYEVIARALLRASVGEGK